MVRRGVARDAEGCAGHGGLREEPSAPKEIGLRGGGVVAGGFEPFDPFEDEAAKWCLFFFWDAWLEVAVVEVCGEVLVFGPEA